MSLPGRDTGGMLGSPAGDDRTGWWSVVVAGGSGARFGRLKQLEPLAGRRVIDWSIAAMATGPRTVVVVPAELVDELTPGLAPAVVVAGGATRSASVRAGLAAVDPAADGVLVHDAARPLVPPEVVARVVEAVVGGADGAIPVVSVTDTIRRRDGSVVDRSELVAVQTPQGFTMSSLRAAHEREDDATDDATLVAASGGIVRHVDGDPSNFKITVADDLAQAAAVLAQRSTDPSAAADRTADMPSPPNRPPPAVSPIRIGQGFDVHPWSDDPERTLVLGGVVFADSQGLAGHSDADAVAHAVTDAVLGACGAGDIGSLFPDTDPTHAGADSIELLRQAVAVVEADGWQVVNADVTVICDAPKLAPQRDAMIANVSAALGGASVSIKGKRTEGVDGLAGGIQSHAVALVQRAPNPESPESGSEETNR